MRQYRVIFFICTLCLLYFIKAGFALAGFGITPPYVKNEGLTRNSQYEQKIIIVRGDPDVDLKAVISIDVPDINEWFTVDKGKEFILPRGEQKVPMVIKVSVPDDADIKKYRGNIRIRTSSLDEGQAGGVSIALGAQIDVDINVVDKEIYNFRVRRITLSDLNEGYKWGWFYFPGKIKFNISIENTGNVLIAPSRVLFNIYDNSGQELLETTENTNRLTKVKPFETGDIIAELPTRLSHGSYVVRYKIYNKEDVKQEGELNLSIMPKGTISGYEGYGLLGLTLKEKSIVVFPLLVVVAMIANISIRSKKRKPRKSDNDHHVLRLRR